MIRTIDGFHQDDEGDWVAELSCLHGQHVRHQPPFQERPWVVTEEGRSSRLGAELDCPRCDRSELPEGLSVARTVTFDEATMPAGLRRDHRVAERTWGLLRVLEGSLRFRLATDPPVDVELRAGASHPIPPAVPHSVEPLGPMRMAVDFLVR